MKATVTDIYKRITITPNKTEGILNYDIDNAYPQRIVNIVNSSGIATSCVGMKTRFLVGGGMSDKDFYKQIVNQDGLTVDKLLRKVASNISTLPYVALHFNYNMLYQKTEVNYIPFTYVRLTTDDNKQYPKMVAIYDDWDRQIRGKIERNKIDYIDLYNPSSEAIQEQVDKAGGWEFYKGQVLLWTPEGVEYTLASFDSVLEDCQTDSKTKSFKFRNITTNFMASHLLVTDKFENDLDRDEFHESLKDYQGADDALKLLHLEKTSNESGIELKPIAIQDVEDLYQYTENSVQLNVVRNFLIPQILMFQVAGKQGTATEIKDATAFYNGITADDRLVIEELFTEAFRNFYYDINPSNDYSIIPFKAPITQKELTAEYFPYVTKNQILESLGLPTVEDFKADTKPLYEALGVGGLQALTSILTGSLTNEQKIATLEIIFRLSNAEAARLAGQQIPQ
ncbi:hypothetical protein UFOVP606_14 [uncultured Caudovirales phage]|uniref:Portal vertex protein n=1 Tax=uncultured Caudovirales phage TaxID=2100421 RepID=A0A6J5N3F2_9CAUD|nr:hypothetical protein UFOVP606_14 [uncultured Caudovirales phage]